MNSKKISLAFFSCLLFANSFQISASERRQLKQSSWYNRISKISAAAMATVTMMLTTTPLVEAYNQTDAREDYQLFADRFVSAFQVSYDHGAGPEQILTRIGANSEYRRIAQHVQNFQQELLQEIPAKVYACQKEQGLIKIAPDGTELKHCRGGQFWNHEEVAKQCETDHRQAQSACTVDVVSRIAPDILKKHQP